MVKILALSVAMGLSTCHWAYAQGSSCGNYEVMSAYLQSDKYSETIVFSGEDNAGVGVVIFANPDTGTYTLLQTFPNGVACIRQAGNEWRWGPPVVEPEGDPV